MVVNGTQRQALRLLRVGSAKEIPQHSVDGIGKFDLRKVAGAVEDIQSALR
jgi:hypothetical protein